MVRKTVAMQAQRFATASAPEAAQGIRSILEQAVGLPWSLAQPTNRNVP